MLEKVIHCDFSNIGFAGRQRAFPGFPEKSETKKRQIGPRDAVRLELGAGDLLSVRPQGAKQSVTLIIFDIRGRINAENLRLTSNDTTTPTCFDSVALIGWLTSNGASGFDGFPSVTLPVDDLLSFKAMHPCTVWAVRPESSVRLVEQASTGMIEMAVKPVDTGVRSMLPEPLGDIRDEFTVRRGTARAYELAPGEMVQVIDIEGQQCSDFMALRSEALEAGKVTGIDGTATRSMVRSAYPGPGLHDKFYDRDLRPMMRVLQDTCGRHDTFGMACTARGYEDRGFPGHLNCSDNISASLGPYGVAYRPAWPAVNFFWNTWIDPHSHHLMTEESHSRPGDYVVLQALDRLVCVSTACPDDLDPINGWNPTDVHVRIYRKDTPIRRAMAYREKENSAMSISQESAFHPATSKLTKDFAPARDLWAPVSFPSIGTEGEYWACRERVTLQDMSSLRKYDIIGPDALTLLQLAMTRDLTRLSVWRGTYALICDDTGAVIDDGTLFRLGSDLFRWCCGSEESERTLQAIARREGLQVRIHGMGSAMPNLALQGPRARDTLRKIAFTQVTVPSLEQLKWFGVTVARLNDRDGLPFMLARSGYTGELGYELFCSKTDAPALWDAVMDAGEEFGIAPMGTAALDIIRIEAGLASRAEFSTGVDAFEAGLGFAVNLGKEDFSGKAALERNSRAPRRALKGLMFSGRDVPAPNALVYAGERAVGVVTSATRSPMFDCTIAMARLSVEHAENDAELEVGFMDGRMKRLTATVCDVPFFDPKRERARA